MRNKNMTNNLNFYILNTLLISRVIFKIIFLINHMKINIREKNNFSLKKDIFNLHICNKFCINYHIYIVKV